MDKYDRFKDPKHIDWAKKVKKRDDFICQICGATNTYLNSHHCNSWDTFENQRFDIDNGITLCRECHENFHAVYGSGKNTRFQFDEYQKLASIILKIASEKR